MEKMHRYSKIEDEFLINNVKGITLKELTRKFNEEFNLDVKESSISNRKLRLGLKSGIVGGQFVKGQIPHNKGKKMPPQLYEKAKTTMFKNGHVPKNRRKVGSERNNRDGYIEIKIADPDKWELKHRCIYESMYGNIPTGYKLIFADGNRQNIDIGNLILVSNAEQLIMNRNKLFSKSPEFTKTGVVLAKVLNKVNKRKN